MDPRYLQFDTKWWILLTFLPALVFALVHRFPYWLQPILLLYASYDFIRILDRSISAPDFTRGNVERALLDISIPLQAFAFIGMFTPPFVRCLLEFGVSVQQKHLFPYSEEFAYECFIVSLFLYGFSFLLCFDPVMRLLVYTRQLPRREQ